MRTLEDARGALPAVPAYRSTRPFSELCVAGQRTRIVERWARMVAPGCFDTPFLHPLVVGAQWGARGESLDAAIAHYRSSTVSQWGPEQRRQVERGYGVGALMWRRWTPHALTRRVRRLEARVAELERLLEGP